MTKVTIVIGELLLTFDSHRQWVNKGQSWFAQVKTRRYIAIDSRDRVCQIGADFSVAERDGAYPIRIYSIQPETPK